MISLIRYQHFCWGNSATSHPAAARPHLIPRANEHQSAILDAVDIGRKGVLSRDLVLEPLSPEKKVAYPLVNQEKAIENGH